MVDTRRLNERQLRALAPLSPEEQRVVYTVAQGTAPGGRVTAAHLASLVTVLEIVSLGAIDDGSGEQVEWITQPP